MATSVDPLRQAPDIDGQLARHISGALSRPLPSDVELRCRMHLLDTLVAIISGFRLPPGAKAFEFAQRLGGDEEATLIGRNRRVLVVHAAMANGMAAHADETDDSHLAGRFHPGCGIVPAALAVSERKGTGSERLLRAIALGYDIGARMTMALGVESARSIRISTHSHGALFGAFAAAGALLDLDRHEAEHGLSYAVQQASGLPYWNRDPDHVEKAFDFGGMGARDGVYAALMAASGFTAPPRPVTGERGYLDAFAVRRDERALVDGLGTDFEISRATLKKWCVGSPVQSVLDALERLISSTDVRAQDIDRIRISMPSDRFHIVDNRDMPSICVQHLAALFLLRGTMTYADAHDDALMTDPSVRALRARIEAVPSDELARARPERQAIVEIHLRSGEVWRHHARVVKGTPDDPMSAADVAAKASDILTPIMKRGAERLIDFCLGDAKFGVAELVRCCATD